MGNGSIQVLSVSHAVRNKFYSIQPWNILHLSRDGIHQWLLLSIHDCLEVRLFTCGRTGLDLWRGHCWTLGLGPRFTEAKLGHGFREFTVEVEKCGLLILGDGFMIFHDQGLLDESLRWVKNALPPHHSFPWLLLGHKPGNYCWMDTVDGRNPAPARAYLTIHYDLYPPHPLFNVVFWSFVRRCRISVIQLIQLLCFGDIFFKPMLNGEHEGLDFECVWWCRIFSMNRMSQWREVGSCVDKVGKLWWRF